MKIMVCSACDRAQMVHSDSYYFCENRGCNVGECDFCGDVSTYMGDAPNMHCTDQEISDDDILQNIAELIQEARDIDPKNSDYNGLAKIRQHSRLTHAEKLLQMYFLRLAEVQD